MATYLISRRLYESYYSSTQTEIFERPGQKGEGEQSQGFDAHV